MKAVAKDKIFRKYAEELTRKATDYWNYWHKPIAARFLITPVYARLHADHREEFKQFLFAPENGYLLLELAEKTGATYCFPASPELGLNEEMRFMAMRKVADDATAKRRLSGLKAYAARKDLLAKQKAAKNET